MTENELIRQLQHHIDQPEVFDPPPRNWRLLCRESIEAIQRLRGNKPHESETSAYPHNPPDGCLDCLKVERGALKANEPHEPA